VLVLVSSPAAGSAHLSRSQALDAAHASAEDRGRLDRASYDLYASYPDFDRVRADEYLKGFNVALVNRDGLPTPTYLWFEVGRDGAFKQFNQAPYDECHWDLLRWGDGPQGALMYFSTHDHCPLDQTDISYSPGISFMPKLWQAGEQWSEHGSSKTLYSVQGIAVCAGVNTWSSTVLGLEELANGEQVVHTQTNEAQTLSPIASAPSSGACPSGTTTSFDWQENYYVKAPLISQGELAQASTGEVRLARSRGGNTALLARTGLPDYDSNFSTWEALPLGASIPGGRLTSGASNVADASDQNTIAFTYTAGPAGLSDGELVIAVPPGWSAPVTANALGCVSASAGTVTVAGRSIAVTGLTLAADATVVISYGATSGGSCAPDDGAASPLTSGAASWQAKERSTAGGPLVALPSSPSIDVDAPDGSGALQAAEGSGSAAPSTITLTYTASAGGLSNGALSVTLPTNWTAPATLNVPGCTTATAGTLTTAGQTITLAGLTLAANTSVVISYGATSGGNCTPSDEATTSPSLESSPLSAAESSTPGVALLALGASAVVAVP